jgi:catechol 2,3-dioxygenase-like lactoylglutathione lyase family enzyme
MVGEFFKEVPMRVIQLDHLVLTVRDIARTVSFYTEVLGMQSRTFGEGRTALHFGNQKLNLHPSDRVLDPNVRHATPGSADVCFVVDEPIDDWMKHLGRHNVPIILGPVKRTGARGELRSIYLYDPDENLVELSNLVPGS